MGFEKGHTHAVGRPKGSLNKNTTKVRELFKDLILENYEQLKYDLGELEPLDRIKMIIENEGVSIALIGELDAMNEG